MKTSVEWLEEEISTLLPLKEGLTVTDYLIKRKYIIEQAKEMEKENTINFAIQCMFSTKDIGSNLKNDFFIKKYNETFKSE